MCSMHLHPSELVFPHSSTSDDAALRRRMPGRRQGVQACDLGGLAGVGKATCVATRSLELSHADEARRRRARSPRRRDRALTQVNVGMAEACDQLKMDQISTNSLPRAHGQEVPKCLSCGQPMHLARTTPGFGGLPERTYNCQICGAVVTQDDGALVRTDRLAHLFRSSGV